MKIAVILENSPDCDLERETFEVPEGEDFDDIVDDKVTDIIERWPIRVGDTIKIREVEA
jgi:hypothetical protein